MKLIRIALLFFVVQILPVKAQELSQIMKEKTDSGSPTHTISQTFSGNRMINGHSVKVPSSGELMFIISHRFGEVTGGASEFWGLNVATVRIGVDYGITERLAGGIGRTTFHGTLDGFAKYRIATQKQGKQSFPVSITALEGVSYQTLSDRYPDSKNAFAPFSFITQTIIARKCSPAVSLQVAPIWLHTNYSIEQGRPVDLFSVGFGGRLKLASRFYLTSEYYAGIHDPVSGNVHPFSLGVDIETGGHVFQLHFTNSPHGMIEKPLLLNSNSKWSEGSIYFGFNITRLFNLT